MSLKYTFVIIAAIILSSCTNNKTGEMKIEDKFTWNIQKAGYDFDKYDEQGETNYQNFIDEFDKFPWMEQLDYFQKHQDGCSATLSVKDLKTGKDFWISMAGDRDNHGYLIGYIYPKEKKGFFGLGKPKQIRWLEIYLTENTELVKDCFKLFFDRNHSQLETKIRKLEEYGQMEAQN